MDFWSAINSRDIFRSREQVMILGMVFFENIWSHQKEWTPKHVNRESRKAYFLSHVYDPLLTSLDDRKTGSQMQRRKSLWRSLSPTTDETVRSVLISTLVLFGRKFINIYKLFCSPYWFFSLRTNLYKNTNLSCLVSPWRDSGCFDFQSRHCRAINKYHHDEQNLTAHNWQKWKRVFLTCPCHEIK